MSDEAARTKGGATDRREAVEELQARLELLERDYEALLETADATRQRVDELTRWALWQQDRLAHITRSRSWRLTAPLRAVTAAVSRLRGGGRTGS